MSIFNFGSVFHHQRIVDSIVASAPPSTKASLNDVVQAALNANVPWLAIAKGLGTMLVGGFSPASIAAGIAIIFQGFAVPASLDHLISPAAKANAVAPAA